MAVSMLYQHRLENLGKVFAARNMLPVIVKGQAIADLAYPADEIRLCADVDILAGDDAVAVADVLLELGYTEKPAHSRFFRFGERVFCHDDTSLPPLVEVHRVLDKILLRPIPYRDIIARAQCARLTGFRYPTLEDLLLLVVLHASSDVYFDAARVERDLHFLLNCKGLDMTVVKQRAQEWQLSTALLRLVNRQYPQGTSKSPASTLAAAFSYFAGQFGWHDSTATVCRGLLYYAWARLCDRFVSC